MIFVMNDKYKNLFVKGLLALLAFSFALAGIIGFSGTMNQANIVKINKTNINVNAFVTFLNNAIYVVYLPIISNVGHVKVYKIFFLKGIFLIL